MDGNSAAGDSSEYHVPTWKLWPYLLFAVLGLYFGLFEGDRMYLIFGLILFGILMSICAVIQLVQPRNQFPKVLNAYLFCIALLISIGITHLPFRIGFAISQKRLTQVAEQAMQGQEIDFPVKAGLYSIKDAGRRRDGSVYLWVHTDPSGEGGFVHGYTGNYYNIWSANKLSEDWYYIQID